MYNDLTGRIFGTLKAIEKIDKKKFPQFENERNVVWKWSCENCGFTILGTQRQILSSRHGGKYSCPTCNPKKGDTSFRDLTNKTLHGFRAVSATSERKNNAIVWNWTCLHCKKTYAATPADIERKICSCQKPDGEIIHPKSDITGERIGQFRAIRPTSKRYGNNIVWEWECSKCKQMICKSKLQVKRLKECPGCNDTLS